MAKKFRFRVEAVLKMRQQAEQLAMRKMADAQQRVAGIEDSVRDLQSRLAQQDELVRQGVLTGTVDVAYMSLYRRHVMALHREMIGFAQDLREAMQAEAHCNALPDDMLPGMVEAQRFRDAGLADAALWARSTTAAQVVVIAGGGHADTQRGMPAAISVADPDVRVVSLGQFEVEPDNPEAWDAWLLAPAPERDDPCLSLTGG